MGNAELYAAIEDYDLEAWVRRHGGKFVKGDEEALMTCPACRKPKLAVNVPRRSWHCWYCASPQGGGQRAKGGMLDLIALVEGRRKGDVADTLLHERRCAPVGSMRPLRQQAAAAPLWAVPIDWPPHWQRLEADTVGYWPYLAQRGITLDDVHQFGLVVCTGGRYDNRLVFPVFERGRLVYYQARAMWERHDQPEGYIKSLNPPKSVTCGTTSEDVLFNLDVARQHPRVAIVEGPIDCVHTGPSAVCSFGKHLSSRQIAKLRYAGVQAVDLMYDGPSPTEPQGAYPEMQKLAPLLASFFDVRLVWLPQGDPGSMPRQQIEQHRAQAVPYRRG